MIRVRFPLLEHLRTLTDDVAVIQHATYDVPNRSTGYCTDDVARALIVATEADEARLVTTYLSFLHDAQVADGWFHNFLGYDRKWQDKRGSSDAFGRALWGLGYTMRFGRRDSWRTLARDLLRRALPHVTGLESPRSRAYATLGLAYAIGSAKEDHGAIETALGALVATLVQDFERESSPEWMWCEPMMTYDNARLCEALMRGGSELGDAPAMRAGRQMFEFLAAVTVAGDTFMPVGSDGWFPRGGTKAIYAQQPLEAAGMVDAALFADAPEIADIAFRWYFGRNIADTALVNGGGCRDGIDAHGASRNMGAESTISYLLAAIALARESAERFPLVR